MTLRGSFLLCVLALSLTGHDGLPRAQSPNGPATYLGFDRNEYPGDTALPTLRQTFSFAGYWLNNPPGAARNSWTQKRDSMKAAGFGFLVLFNGRLDSELKRSPDSAAFGQTDAAAAADSARREGFPQNTVIFLDIEEGGRMLPEQKAYIYAWTDSINAAGFRAGVYCSGIPAAEGRGTTVVTAEDLREHAGQRNIVYWVANDTCPPAPGCAYPKTVPAPSQSGVSFAAVWQFAQSPMRRDVAHACRATYASDGNCYPPMKFNGSALYIDLDAAESDDPSNGR